MPDVLPAGHFRFASESLTEGHPDKFCDRVSDAILDACLAQDNDSRVTCDACTKAGMVMILGQVVTKANLNFEQLIREAAKAVGYDSDEKGLDWRTMNVIVAVEDQGPDFAAALVGGQADDANRTQGVAFGYASDEAPDAMPLSQTLASKLSAQMDKLRKDGSLGWLFPDARIQVTVEYKEDADGAVVPVRVQSISILARHNLDVDDTKAQESLQQEVVKAVIPERLLDGNTKYSFTWLSGLGGGSGLSGRKLDVDTYGGWTSSGSEQLSGRDGSSFARSASYGARWAARSLVAARLCRRCSVQISYIPGSAEPSSVHVQSYGTGRSSGRSDAELAELIAKNFDFRPSSLKRDLGLALPQFQRLSAYGHCGRVDLDLPWEKPKALN